MLRIALFLTTLLLAAHSPAAPLPDMSRRADFSVLTAPESGYRFHTLDFPAAAWIVTARAQGKTAS